MEISNQLTAEVTVLSNRFIDEYMRDANGEYVKVYLYFVRHEGEVVTIAQAALALDSTETDVRRAVEYWRKAGVFRSSRPEAEMRGTAAAELKLCGKNPAEAEGRMENPAEAEGRMENPVEAGDRGENPAGAKASGEDPAGVKVRGEIPAGTKVRGAAAAEGTFSGRTEGRTPAPADIAREEPRGISGGVTVDMEALSRDDGFSQLLYISEQYMGKLFSVRDTEVLGNLYQNLGMSEELLEFLMEYCAQNGHKSLRYAEKVALSWVSDGIRTVEQAKAASGNYIRRTYLVMKAMGLSSRNPAPVEQAAISRWFEEYGFSEEIVAAACNRTIERIHKPSFQYAEGILRDWKEAGVRSMKDVEADDRRRAASEKRTGASRAAGRSGNRQATRFNNFEGHGYDYDQIMWEMVNSGEPGKNGGKAGGADGAE
jgi:DnaD/phage-associated family protein